MNNKLKDLHEQLKKNHLLVWELIEKKPNNMALKMNSLITQRENLNILTQREVDLSFAQINDFKELAKLIDKSNEDCLEMRKAWSESQK